MTAATVGLEDEDVVVVAVVYLASSIDKLAGRRETDELAGGSSGPTGGSRGAGQGRKVAPDSCEMELRNGPVAA